MKRILIFIVGGLLTHSALVAGEATRQAMRLKLDYARGTLEGLAMARFDLVLTNAASLRDLSQTNAFFLTGNPEYLRRCTNFFNSVDRMIRAAQEKNLDRATTAYAEVTRNCVECHKTFRREQFVESQRQNPPK